MKDFSEIKNAVLSSLGRAADAGKGIANKAADRAKSSARIAKLSMEIASERENLKKSYIEIGKLYYDTHRDDPDGFFIQLCDEVAVALKSIEDKEAEIEELKSSEADGDDTEIDIEIEFEKVVEEDEAAATADTAEEAPDTDTEEASGTEEEPASEAEAEEEPKTEE